MPKQKKARELLPTGYFIDRRTRVDKLIDAADDAVEEGNLEAARQHLDKALFLDPSNPVALSKLADVFTELGKHGGPKTGMYFEKAIELYRKAIEKSQIFRFKKIEAAAWNNLGVACAAVENFAEAFKSFDHSLNLEPNNWHFNYCASLAYAAARRKAEAIDLFMKAESHVPSSADKEEQAEMLYNIGLGLLKIGEDERALGAFGRAILKRPDYSEALLQKGYLLLGKGLVKEAEAAFESAYGAAIKQKKRKVAKEAQEAVYLTGRPRPMINLILAGIRRRFRYASLYITGRK